MSAEPEADLETSNSYDEIADGYVRWWGPVILPGALPVLDLLAPEVESRLAKDGEASVLDVGTGTGALAVAALERWPRLRVTGIDPSGGMLEMARRDAEARLAPAVAARYETVAAPADELPFDDTSFDLAMSSFVLQLVPSRAAALREVRRVLRPGGAFAWVAWQRSERAYEPDRIANEVLDDAGFDPPEPEARPGDLASPAAAALGMRRAGFREVTAHVGGIAHAWDARSYLEFFTLFDEASLFADLEPRERAEIEDRILERLEGLRPDELTLRLPAIYVVGRTGTS